jgi:uncharacterized protein YbaP (TraB family)
MNSKPTLALLCCALAFGGGEAEARDRHTLWTVEGRHNTVYLLGSVHVLRAGDAQLPAVAEAAYEDAEQLVMEIDLDDVLGGDPSAMLGVMQQMAMLPADTSLREVLGADYDAVNERTRAAGLDLALLDRFAPWFVAVTVLQLELTKRGFSPDLGVEQTLATRAIADGKPILGLETAEQQFGLLGSLPLPQQKRFLMMTLEDTERLDEQVDDLIGAWRTGDAEALSNLLSEEFTEFPELYRALTEDRNRDWLDDIVDLLDDRDDYLVVVGALHLVGRNSVVDLLRQRGYEVTQQ